MSPRVPKWLDREYIESVLRVKYCDETIKVVELKVLSATEKDQNFASVIFRLQVQYKSRKNDKSSDTSFIIKTSLENGDNQNLHNALEVFDVYEHEAFVYEEVLPKVGNLLLKINYEKQLAPSIIKFDRKRKSIIFEDLCQKGYLMCNKRVGLDMRHVKMILEKVAKFHAAAARLNEISHGKLQEFNKSIFTIDSNEFEPFFAGQLRVCGLSLQRWKGYEIYGEKILKMVPKVMDYGRYTYQWKPNYFNTIIHGDLWINNTLFRYDDDDSNKPIDVILLDFQFSCWSSPAIDLHYLFNTSINFDTRVNCEEELIKYYYKNLVDSLKKLEYTGNIPSYGNFWEQYVDTNFYAITSTCAILPLILNEKEIDNSSLMKDDDSLIGDKKEIYNQHKIQKFLKRLLPIYDIRGYLDKPT